MSIQGFKPPSFRTISGIPHPPSPPPIPNPPVNGRVLRLHFACRAPLPIGSLLRVTSSSFWATMASSSSPAPVVATGGGGTTETDEDPHDGENGIYSSSVEMVTDPESYPLWRTRNPVIAVVNDAEKEHEEDTTNHPLDDLGNNTTLAVEEADARNPPTARKVFEHRYRYVVITPGAASQQEYLPSSPSTSTTNSRESPVNFGSIAGSSSANLLLTSDGSGGVLPVGQWEDPFTIEVPLSKLDESTKSLQDTMRSDVTGLSGMDTLMDSPDNAMAPKSVMDLPYRTIQIDVSSAKSPSFGTILTNDEQQPNQLFTDDGVRIDTWNGTEDASFVPYLNTVKAAQDSSDVDLDVSDKNNLQNDIEDIDEFHIAQLDSTGSQRSHDEEYFEANEHEPMAIVFEETPPKSPPKSPPTEPKPPHKKRLFLLVCFHLPVNITHDAVTDTYHAEFSDSILAKTEEHGISKSDDLEPHWIGTVSPDIASGRSSEAQKAKVRAVLAPMSCTPIFLDERMMDMAYNGMCKQVLWPAFHNIDLLDISKSGWGQNNLTTAPDFSVGMVGGNSMEEYTYGVGAGVAGRNLAKFVSDWDQSRLDGWWGAYRDVNQIFAEAIVERIGVNDIVWVHDYHLVLLPKMLDIAERKLRGGERTVQMVFFLHIPFPTSQVFRELEHGESILEGMLHADVVGFHAYDHARHFLNASKRILGLVSESLVGGLIGVRYRKTKVIVTISNVSIESDVVSRALALPSVEEDARRLKDRHRGRTIIAGLDIAQGLSGLSLKLLAYEKLLGDYPNWQEKVVLVQRTLIPGSRVADESDTLSHVRYLVERIRKGYGDEVIDYVEIAGSTLPMPSRLVLWLAADVLMCTPIREGLNLLPLEYSFARRSPATPGVTITSEFSTVCSILNGALRVNPFDIQVSSTSIDTALTMDMNDRVSRRERDMAFISSCSSGSWTRHVLTDLNDVALAAQGHDGAGYAQSTLQAKKKMESISDNNSSLEQMMPSTLLDFNAVNRAYHTAQRRVICLDFNGTIVMKEATGKYLKRDVPGASVNNRPPNETMDALRALCADKRNVVYVISGDTPRNIEDAIGGIPGLGLAAGNGGIISRPLRVGETERQWETFDLGVDWEAVKKLALPVLAKYTARANGSYVKLTSSSIGWSYFSCDPEWGSTLATTVLNELEDVLCAFDVRFVTLKGVVEVVPKILNKGLAVRNILGKEKPDFVLCMGDDVSDEKMFTAVFSCLAEMSIPKQSLADTTVGYNSGQQQQQQQQQQDQQQQLQLRTAYPKSGTSYAYTVTVGKKASHASYYVECARDVASLLMQISGNSKTHDRALSWNSETTPYKDFA